MSPAQNTVGPLANAITIILLILINPLQADSTNPPKSITRPRGMAREFLIAHNLVRIRNNEPPLIWSKKLARYARRWANTRVSDCKMIHSYGPHGENIFWGGRDHWTPSEVVGLWVDESKYYDSKSNACQEGQMCGHYTQVVWRSTTRVGCGKAKCNDGGMFAICSYDPPGNWVDQGPFDQPPSTTTPPASII